MPLPWLIGAALVGVATAVASSSSSSERSDNSDDLKREKEEKDKSLKIEEIVSFKENSINKIKNKYKVNIYFENEELKVIKDDTNKIVVLKKHIKTLKSENENIRKVTKKLEDAKNAI